MKFPATYADSAIDAIELVTAVGDKTPGSLVEWLRKGSRSEQDWQDIAVVLAAIVNQAARPGQIEGLLIEIFKEQA